MATTVWCLPCGADGNQTPASVRVDGDPMCKPCANYLQNELVRTGNARLPEETLSSAETPAKPTGAPGVCAKGCGWRKHYGVCPARRPEETSLCACGKPKHHRGRCPGTATLKAEAFVGTMETPAPVEMSPGIDLPITRRLCARGCGQPVHKGHCLGVPHGRQNLSAEAMSERSRKAAATRREHEGGRAVELEVVDELPMPEAPKLLRKGRIGEIWDALDTLPGGKWLKIPNRDRGHLGTTSRELRAGAAKLGATLEMESRGTDLFVRWVVPEGLEVRA